MSCSRSAPACSLPLQRCCADTSQLPRPVGGSLLFENFEKPGDPDLPTGHTGLRELVWLYLIESTPALCPEQA